LEDSTINNKMELNNKADSEYLQKYFDELNLETRRNQIYHDHKERMAWLAFAFYIPAIIFWGSKAGEVLNSLNLPCYIFVIFIAVPSSCGFFFTPFILAFLFINMQFRCRWIAAKRITALEKSRALLITDPKLFVAEIYEFKKEIKNKKGWPTLIEYIDSRFERRESIFYDINQGVKYLKKSGIRISKPSDTILTEAISYIGLIFATAAAIVIFLITNK